MSDLDCFIEDDPGRFQREIDNFPCFPAFTGVGDLRLRCYTALGPTRLDLANSLHKRSADSPIQVYISLGQAF